MPPGFPMAHAAISHPSRSVSGQSEARTTPQARNGHGLDVREGQDDGRFRPVLL